MHMHADRDRQTDGQQAGRQVGRQTDRQTDMHLVRMHLPFYWFVHSFVHLTRSVASVLTGALYLQLYAESRELLNSW